MIAADPFPLAPSAPQGEGSESALAPSSPKPFALAPQVLFSVGDQCLVSGTNFLTLVIVGRASGLHELGVYSLAFTVIVILMALQESLLIAPYTVIMSRLHGEKRRGAYATATLRQQLLVASASTVVLIASAGAASLSHGAEYSILLAVLAVATPFWLLKEFARRACFVEMNTRCPILLDCVVACVQLCVLCILWTRGELSASSALAAAGVGHAAATTIWWIAFRPAIGLERSMFRRALRLNWAFGSWACVGRVTEMAHAYSLHWLLTIVSGPAATGCYVAASSLLAVSNPLLMGIGNLLAPETARSYAAGGLVALRQVVFRASCHVTLVTAAFVVLLGANAEWLLRFAFGESLEGQATVVVILSVGMLVGITSFGADNGLRALARPAENFKAGLAGFAVSFLIGAALVGRWEAIGAACGALAGNLTAALVRIGAFLRVVRARSAMTTTISQRTG